MKLRYVGPFVCFAVGLANATYGLTLAPMPWVSVTVALFALGCGGYMLGSIKSGDLYEPLLNDAYTL